MSILREPGGLPPEYAHGTDLFTMKVNYNGQFELVDGKLQYVDGKVDYFDMCDVDLMSMLELEDFAGRLGIEENVTFKHWLGQGNTLGQLQVVEDDMDVMSMLTYIGEERILEIFMVVPIKPLCFDYSQISNEEDGEVEEDVEVEEEDDMDAFTDMQAEFDLFEEYYGFSMPDSEQAAKDITEDPNLPSGEAKAADEEQQQPDEGLKEADLHDVPLQEEDENVEFVDSDFEQSDSENDDQNEANTVPQCQTTEDNHLDENSKGKDKVEVDSDFEWSEDELNSSCESDNEPGVDQKKGKKRYTEFNPEVDFAAPWFRLGMVFPTVQDFRKAIREYAIKERRDVWFPTNERHRVRAKCRGTCPWTVFASAVRDSESLVVKTTNEEHTCTKFHESKFINSVWLSNKYESKWETEPEWKRVGFQREVRKETGKDVSRWQFYRARKKALNKIRGSTQEQYHKLWDYCGALKECDPTNTVKMKVNGNERHPHFERLYVCLGACKKGWKEGCRPLIGLDGCHVKGPHTGQLLVAIGIDPENSVYPIAYAAVESENGSTWKWFLDFLKDDLDIVNDSQVTWITDKQKGLIEAVHEVFSGSAHRFCVRHLYNNFKLKFKGLVLKQTLWNAARASTKQRYEAEMEKMKALDPAAYQWLIVKDPIHWARSHFDTASRCDILLNNICEVFNACILDARDQPIITMMETIRRYIRKRLVSRKEKMAKWHYEVGPRIIKIIEKNRKDADDFTVDYCGEGKFEVRNYYVNQVRVDINAKTCDCYKWDLTGIPCCHAMACIARRDLNLMDYVDICYKKPAYLSAYTPIVLPMAGPSMWKKTGIRPPIPPKERKLPGRPKKQRRKEPEELTQPGTATKKLKKNYVVITCSKCRGQNHNAAGCPNFGNRTKPGESGTNTSRKVSLSKGKQSKQSMTKEKQAKERVEKEKKAGKGKYQKK